MPWGVWLPPTTGRGTTDQFEHLSSSSSPPTGANAGAGAGGGTAGSIGDSWPPTAGNAAAVGAAMWYCLKPSAIIAAAISASGKGSSAAAAAPSPLLPPPAPAPMAGAAAGAAGAAPLPLLPGWQPPPPPAPMAGAKPPTAGWIAATSLMAAFILKVYCGFLLLVTPPVNVTSKYCGYLCKNGSKPCFLNT